MRRWITRLFGRIRYGKIYQPTEWQREPEEPFIATVPPLPEPPGVVHWHTGAWSRYYLDMHPQLKAPHRVEFFTEEDWTRIQAEDEAFAVSELDTRKVTTEETAKYEALPWWMK